MNKKKRFIFIAILLALVVSSFFFFKSNNSLPPLSLSTSKPLSKEEETKKSIPQIELRTKVDFSKVENDLLERADHCEFFYKEKLRDATFLDGSPEAVFEDISLLMDETFGEGEANSIAKARLAYFNAIKHSFTGGVDFSISTSEAVKKIKLLDSCFSDSFFPLIKNAFRNTKHNYWSQELKAKLFTVTMTLFLYSDRPIVSSKELYFALRIYDEFLQSNVFKISSSLKKELAEFKTKLDALPTDDDLILMSPNQFIDYLESLTSLKAELQKLFLKTTDELIK